MYIVEKVYQDGIPVGSVQLEKQGMYYIIRCSCDTNYGEEYELQYVHEDHCHVIGTYIAPNQLVTRQSIKDIGCGQFILAEKNEHIYRIPLAEQDIVTVLQNLPNLQLAIKEGRPCLFIKCPDPEPQDNGQSR